MALPQPQQQPVTLEVLAFQLQLLQSSLDKVLVRLDTTASREDVTELKSRVRVLEDDRTARRAIITAAGILGVGGVGAVLRWAMTA